MTSCILGPASGPRDGIKCDSNGKSSYVDTLDVSWVHLSCKADAGVHHGECAATPPAEFAGSWMRSSHAQALSCSIAYAISAFAACRPVSAACLRRTGDSSRAAVGALLLHLVVAATTQSAEPVSVPRLRGLSGGRGSMRFTDMTGVSGTASGAASGLIGVCTAGVGCLCWAAPAQLRAMTSRASRMPCWPLRRVSLGTSCVLRTWLSSHGRPRCSAYRRARSMGQVTLRQQ